MVSLGLGGLLEVVGAVLQVNDPSVHAIGGPLCRCLIAVLIKYLCRLCAGCVGVDRQLSALDLLVAGDIGLGDGYLLGQLFVLTVGNGDYIAFCGNGRTVLLLNSSIDLVNVLYLSVYYVEGVFGLNYVVLNTTLLEVAGLLSVMLGSGLGQGVGAVSKLKLFSSSTGGPAVGLVGSAGLVGDAAVSGSEGEGSSGELFLTVYCLLGNGNVSLRLGVLAVLDGDLVVLFVSHNSASAAVGFFALDLFGIFYLAVLDLEHKYGIYDAVLLAVLVLEELCALVVGLGCGGLLEVVDAILEGYLPAVLAVGGPFCVGRSAVFLEYLCQFLAVHIGIDRKLSALDLIVAGDIGLGDGNVCQLIITDINDIAVNGLAVAVSDKSLFGDDEMIIGSQIIALGSIDLNEDISSRNEPLVALEYYASFADCDLSYDDRSAGIGLHVKVECSSTYLVVIAVRLIDSHLDGCILKNDLALIFSCGKGLTVNRGQQLAVLVDLEVELVCYGVSAGSRGLFVNIGLAVLELVGDAVSSPAGLPSVDVRAAALLVYLHLCAGKLGAAQIGLGEGKAVLVDNVVIGCDGQGLSAVIVGSL